MLDAARGLAVLAAATLSMALATACGGSSSSPAATAAPTASATARWAWSATPPGACATSVWRRSPQPVAEGGSPGGAAYNSVPAPA